MSTPLSAACDQAEQSGATALQNLAQIEAALRDVQTEVAKLPFFVRGFVTSEIKRGSGQDIPAWLERIGALTAFIGEAQATVHRVRSAGAVSGTERTQITQAMQRIDAERPEIEKLTAFMQSAPSKVNSVPPGIMPADRRDEFLSAVDRQVQSLRGVLAALGDLSHGLQALSEAAS